MNYSGNKNRNRKKDFSFKTPKQKYSKETKNYKKIDKTLSGKVIQVKAEDIASEIAEARKRLFAIFDGQLEKAIGE